ncbi:LYR motif-containing protein 4 [Neocloeon triangulifer]|uniref:LYR motif-containing protein 4 n=1 Tax=Neocloeon triangulifer TaxID=2078957 RepID=UPI00286EBFC4|nr:LYR motif-containing protein 4 [Neocloeon triangulifer]
MAASRVKVLELYKNLLREGQKFADYNFRNYAVRRMRDAFKENKTLADGASIEKELKFGFQQLELIKRQALISQMFKTEKLVIEKPL